ncbi:MAG: polysaccharide biosynthesis tyrosine autokinase [Bacteroidaceae bacterium]|nr:polysaccharide biosynthesis tyrosine autokinase [Bacteroidaceae bacterium]
MTHRRSANESTDEGFFSLRDLIETLQTKWVYFLISVLIFGALTWLYLSTRTPLFQRHAVILVKDDATSGTSSKRSTLNTSSLMQLNGVLGGTSVKNELYILKSYQLMREVVKTLGLDVQYTYRYRMRDIPLYKERPVTVSFASEYRHPLSFRLTINGTESVTISDVRYGERLRKMDFTQTLAFGETADTPFGQFSVEQNEKTLQRFAGETVTVSRYSIEDAAIMTCSQVSTSEMDKESTLVILTCTDSNIRRADDILSSILDAYKKSIIQNKNEIAQSTADFIDDRIALISIELGEVENEMAQFKQKNGLTDIKANSDAFLGQTAAARQRTIQAETQYNLVKYLSDYVARNIQGHNLIPSLGGIADAGIQTQIAQFNQLMLTRNNLAATASEESPSVQEMDSNLAQMRQAIIASLDGFESSLKLQLTQARKDEQGLTATMHSVPQKEREFIDISRQQAIKETLFTFLLNRREETALQLAITEANISIVEHPFGSKHPVAPRRRIIMLLGLLLGFIVPLVFFRVRALLNMTVRGRRDIEAYTSIPVLGEVPHRHDGIDDAAIVVNNENDDALGEAFRLLRFSMNFIKRDAHVIMFTSTMPGEGKTFISRNFAATIGITGKRVVLVDTDIRKRTQSRLTSSTRKGGLTSYLSGAVTDLASLIITDGIAKQVDFLPAGITPPNPAELLMSERLDECMNQLRTMYDYVIIDNVPAQVVADAGIVNRVADLTIYVVREGKVDRRYLPELERLHQEGKFNNLCIVINDASMEKKVYGYGYKAEEPKRGLSRLFRKKH